MKSDELSPLPSLHVSPTPADVGQAFGVRDRVVIVTGAAGWIGQSIAEVFAANGARVVASDRAGPELDAAAGALPGALAIAADLTDVSAVKALVEQAAGHFGRLDAVIACGGIAYTGPAMSDKDEEFDRVFHTNLRSAWVLARSALAHLEKTQGCIVNISSVNGIRPMFPGTLYAASKAALINMTTEMAVEFGPRRVRVNCVSPGPIANLRRQTQWMMRRLHEPHAGAYAALVEASSESAGAASQPLAVGGRPVDVAMACVYLCAPAARYVTGTNLLVDGGYIHEFHGAQRENGETFRGRLREWLRALPAEAWKEKPPEWLQRA